MESTAEAIFASPSELIAASNKAAEKAGASASRKAPKKRVKKPASGMDRLAAWLNEPEPTIIADIPPAPPLPAEEVLPKVRKRAIMGRYVFGDELKPGERWKRPLRKTR